MLGRNGTRGHVEQFDVCTYSTEPPPLQYLPEQVCWVADCIVRTGWARLQ